MRRIIVLIVLVLLALNSFAAPKEFKVFESISGMTNMPSLSEYGFNHLHIVYNNGVFDGDQISDEQIGKSIAFIKKRGYKNVATMITVWNYGGKFNQDQICELTEQINGKFKEAVPGLTIANYGFPVFNLNLLRWKAEQAGKAENYDEVWYKTNVKFFQAAKVSDVLFPSVYNVNDDMEQWKKDVKIMIDLCHEICPGKKVYPFIMFQYYNVKESEQANEFISLPTWNTMLEYLYEVADGVVIYSVGRDVDNKTKVDWYDERVQLLFNASTKFMKKHKIK